MHDNSYFYFISIFSTWTIMGQSQRYHAVLLDLFLSVVTTNWSHGSVFTYVTVLPGALRLIGRVCCAGTPTARSVPGWTTGFSYTIVYWMYPGLHSVPHVDNKHCTTSSIYCQPHTNNIPTLRRTCNGYTLVLQEHWTIKMTPLLFTELS